MDLLGNPRYGAGVQVGKRQIAADGVACHRPRVLSLSWEQDMIHVIDGTKVGHRERKPVRADWMCKLATFLPP